MISENHFWYHKFEFLKSDNDILISENVLFFLYQECDIQNLIFWYQKSFFWYHKFVWCFWYQIFLLISGIWIFDIRKCLIFYFWYQEFDFFISEIHFLIWQIRILEIRQWVLYFWRSDRFLLISGIWIFWYQKMSLFYIKNVNFWYRKSYFWKSEIIFWHHKFEFLKSNNDF